MHFFDISTSKSGPELVCVVHFDFHNSVQFFISHLASWIRTRHFSEPTFRPSGATNHWKNTVFRDFPTFSRTCIFFLLTLSLLWSSLFYSSLLMTLPVSAFHLSILSEVWLLNFLRLSRIAMNKRNMIPCVQCETWGYDVGHSSHTETKAMQPWFIWRANITKYLQIKLYIYTVIWSLLQPFI